MFRFASKRGGAAGRLAALIIAAGLAFTASVPDVRAVDFKARGEIRMVFDYGQNGNFTGGHGQTGYNGSTDEFRALQRTRLWFDAVASENLSGQVYFQIGNTIWGKASQGGALGADETNIKVRRAYLDWMIPNSSVKVRMGMQGFQLPTYAMQKSQVFDEDVAGVVLSGPISENVAATIFWNRPFNDNHTGDDACYMDNLDVFGFTLPLSFPGVKVTPWAVYAAIGPNTFRGNGDANFDNFVGESKNEIRDGLLPAWGVVSGGGAKAGSLKLDDYASAWWAGVSGDITVASPFRAAFECYYGATRWENSRLDREGWIGAVLLEYQLDWATPGIYGWYASGDDSDLGNGSERMPYLTLRRNDNDFSAFAFDATLYPNRKQVLGTSITGTWGIGARLKKMTFFEGFDHTLAVNLIGGTNDHEIFTSLAKTGALSNYTINGGTGFGNMYLTDQDSLVEFNFATNWQMYKNLKIGFTADYLLLNLAKTKFEGMRRQLSAGGSPTSETRDAWNISLAFQYFF